MLCIVQTKPGIFRLSVGVFFCGKVERSTESVGLQETNNELCIAITFLDYLDDGLGAFLLHRVIVTVIYPILVSAAK